MKPDLVEKHPREDNSHLLVAVLALIDLFVEFSGKKVMLAM